MIDKNKKDIIIKILRGYITRRGEHKNMQQLAEPLTRQEPTKFQATVADSEAIRYHLNPKVRAFAGATVLVDVQTRKKEPDIQWPFFNVLNPATGQTMTLGGVFLRSEDPKANKIFRGIN